MSYFMVLVPAVVCWMLYFRLSMFCGWVCVVVASMAECAGTDTALPWATAGAVLADGRQRGGADAGHMASRCPPWALTVPGAAEARDCVLVRYSRNVVPFRH